MALVLVAMLVIAALAPLPAAPRSAGILGQTRGGCTCHNQTESFGVEVELSGLPDSWEAGEEYELNVSYSGGPPRGPGARAGFNLRASAGELMVLAGDRFARVDPGTGEATHTKEGSNASSWHVMWRSPSEGRGDVTFSLVVNAVNGDGIQGPGDQWGRLEVEVAEGDPGGLGAASPFWVVMVVAAVMAIAALGWYATRGPRVDRGGSG
ncbi:MAG: hypothetical protein JSW25_08885 [Thermoplasmata archaeon]|nr:MAG: hypothetical protein JSW25_08885 [Thermoplasmata archaeon]